MPPKIGIAGQEVKADNANETIVTLDENKTLIVEKLTDKASITPAIIEGLTTTAEVFAHFKPTKKVEFTNEDGVPVKETMHFHQLGDFGKEGLTAQSELLKELAAQKEDYFRFMKVLKSNAFLQELLKDPDAKAAYIAGIQAMITELEIADAA